MRNLFSIFLTSSAKLSVLLLLGSLIGACGFHLRKPVDLPDGMDQIYVKGLPPGSRFVNYLNQTVKLSDGQVTGDLSAAGLVLNVYNDHMDRREVSLSQTGKANEYELTYLLDYDLQLPDGEVVLPRQSIRVIRDYFNPQINVIGKSEEEGVIRNEMYKEAARTLLRRSEIALRRSDVPPAK